jgi:hypothetical protein
MTLGNSTGEQLAQEVDDLLKAPGNDGEPSPWGEVTLYYGRRDLERNTTRPRVCWVPIGGPLEMGPYTGGRGRVAGKEAMQLRSAGLQHDVFVHNHTFEDTESLWRAVVASIVLSFRGSVELEDFEWVTETSAGDFVVDGTMIRQRVSIATPIHNTDRTTVEVLYQRHTGTFQGPTGDEDVCT